MNTNRIFDLMRRYITIICFIASGYAYASQNHGLSFKENKNQWPQKVGFAADLPAGQVFIEKQGLTWSLFNYSDIQKNHDKRLSKVKEGAVESEDIIHGHVFKVEFENAQLANCIPSKIQPEYYNYFLGNNPANWASNVKAYEEVYYKDIYKNIDVKFYSNNEKFKYDFVIKPGGDINQIKLNYHYTNGIDLRDNKLVIHTSIGDLLENIPEAYQIINGKKIKIECRYVLLGRTQVSFEVGQNYNSNYELIIDPVVVVASYSGTESVSFGLGVAPDKVGNMYLYSINITKNYPIAVGAIQPISGRIYDCTLSKFNSTGTTKRFSTYIGGNQDERIINCQVQNNEVAIFGTTRSDTFPIINTGFQTKIGGNFDYFVVKLDTSGKTLIGSTYLGGTKAEGSSNIAGYTAFLQSGSAIGEMIMDEWNNCYIIGCTYSHDFPSTPGSYRVNSDSNGLTDITITKFNAKLTAPFWSTYFGGSFANYPVGIRISKSGALYCAGTTSSRNFPTTPGVVFTNSVSTLDMVMFSLDTLGGYPIVSSYMGAKSTESIRFDLDHNDDVYLIGGSIIAAPQSITTTPGAYNVNTGSFVFYKVNSNLSQINAIAKFGYTNASNNTSFNKIEIDAMNIDSCGYIYFGGFGYSGLPVTPNALKLVGNPRGNIYFGIFSPNFTSLKYGSYYGATEPVNRNVPEDHDDGGLNYFDDRGYFYHANCIGNNFPITSNAYSSYNVKDSAWGGTKNSDAFIKIDLQTFVNVKTSLGNQIKSCSPITTTFVAASNLGSVTIIPGDGSPAVNTNSLIRSYNAYGTYTAFIIAGSDSTTCNVIDSVKILIKYGPKPTRSLEDNSINCNGNTLLLDAGNSGSNYIWNTGETTQQIKPQQSGLYSVFIDNDFCTSTFSTQVIVGEEHSFSLPNAFTPNGDLENDSFCLKGWSFCNEEFKVMIFSRWGEKVFESTDPNFCWDGRYKGQVLSADVYVYHIKATYKGNELVNKKGNITLIR